jgi:hypothetical protein
MTSGDDSALSAYRALVAQLSDPAITSGDDFASLSVDASEVLPVVWAPIQVQFRVVGAE